ncbi:monooxygenase [Phialemonium atrogriseum]|uniref:Monooxygenase n=1 Tax=Phialemonium atrogriseum TaxID=1093897 RepID=A0AAJ0FD67_9PEZI|nr:monooxygenase [Phialemonium atrogriseum]KAK1764291.1 monooxygenase [Phialemonium atrogriseum]
MLSATVLIVGAGPVGLWLALELRRGAVDVLVIDTKASRDNRDGFSKALNMSAGTLATFDSRGLATPFLAEGFPLPKAHFGALETLLDLNEQVLGLRHSYNLAIPQARTEAILLRQCEDAGVRFAWGLRFLRLDQLADSVVATTRKVTGDGPDGDGETVDIEAAYLVGCDGTHSAVRAAAGIPFLGTPGAVTGVLADVQLTQLPFAAGSSWAVRRTAKGSAMIVTTGDGTHYRFVCMVRDARDAPASQPLAMDEVRAHLRDAYGSDLGAHSPAWLSRFGSACRVAGGMRAGRVLIAGDAAHQFLPAGGQGMNLGLQDATNLGWKLAFAVNHHRHADAVVERVLDSYSRERVPVAREVVDNVLAQLALLLAEKPHENALRAVVRESLTVPAVNALWARRMTGLGEPQAPYRVDDGDDTLVGLRVAHLHAAPAGEADGDDLLVRAMEPGRFVLLLRGDQAGDEDGHAELRAEAARWAGGVDVLACDTRASDSRWDGVTAVLLRPDERVAWAGRAGTPGVALRTSLAGVLGRWLGERAQGA